MLWAIILEVSVWKMWQPGLCTVSYIAFIVVTLHCCMLFSQAADVYI